MRSGCVALLMSLLMASSVRLVAQQPAGTAPGTSAPVPTIRTTARLVVLDVVVTDGHGQPVTGLKASDFALSEDGVPQSISSFTEHDGTIDAASAQAAPELPPNTFEVHPPVMGNGAMTAIVLGGIAFQDAPFVRDQLKAYFKTTSPATPIAIFETDYLGTHLIQDFTADPKVLQEAAASKRILPPLGLEPMGNIVRRGTLDLAQYLNKIPGRINVIWFSSGGGGVPGIGQRGSNNAFADLSSFVQDLNGPRSVLRLSRVASYAVDASGLTCGVSSTSMCESAVQIPSAAPFHLPDAANLPDAAFEVPSARIAEMAEATGGKAFYNTNGFKEAIAGVVATGAHYYTVSYTPTNREWDSSFRRIHLNVNTGAGPIRKLIGWVEDSVRVQYRTGYYARSTPLTPVPVMAGYPAPPEAELSQRTLISTSPRGNPGLGRGAQDDPLHRAMAFASPTPIDLPFRITVTPSSELDRTKADQPLPKDNYLSVDWKTTPYRNFRVHYSIDAKDMHLHAAGDGARTTFRFVIVVYRDNGEPVNSIATTVSVDPKALDYKDILRNGLSFDQTIAIPAKINTNAVPVTANFFVRTGVQEVETGRIGVVEVPVEWVKVLPVKLAAQGPVGHPSP